MRPDFHELWEHLAPCPFAPVAQVRGCTGAEHSLQPENDNHPRDSGPPVVELPRTGTVVVVLHAGRRLGIHGSMSAALFAVRTRKYPPDARLVRVADGTTLARVARDEECPRPSDGPSMEIRSWVPKGFGR
jgi:hypothetical protein